MPLIGRIPLIGALFRNRTTTSDRTRFYVLIRADVLRDTGFEDLKYMSKSMADSAGAGDSWPTVTPRVIK